MRMRGGDSGKVYFLDREEVLRPPGKLIKIADSFSEMMNELVTMDAWK